MKSLARRVLAVLIGLLCSTVILLVSAEIFTRASGAIDRINVFPRKLFVPTDNPALPYRLRAGVDVKVLHNSVRVNRVGLRGAEIEAKPAAGVRRILILGDSVVYGQGVEEPDTFPVLLEKELRARNLEAEVLNAGAPGYNTRSEVAFLRDVGLSLSPNDVILGVSLNDFTETPKLSPLGYVTAVAGAGENPCWLSRNSEFFILSKWFVTLLRGQHWWQRGEGRLLKTRPSKEDWEALNTMFAGFHRQFYADLSDPRWSELRATLRDLASLSTTEDLDLALIVFPTRDQLDSPNPDLLPQQRWMELCTEFGLRCLDLHPIFAAAETEAPLYQDLQHPTAAGMRVAASATADFLSR